MNSLLTDNELLANYKLTGEYAVIGELYKRYSHLVFSVCIKYLKDKDDAKDAVMQIFEKLLTDLKKHDITFFKSWLYQVCKNHCLMWLRSRKPTVELPQYIYEDDEDEVRKGMEFPYIQHPDGIEEKEKRLTGLENAIKELKEEQRICIDLFYIQEKSYNEIIDLTGLTYMQVKSFIQNGKRNLKIMLERVKEK